MRVLHVVPAISQTFGGPTNLPSLLRGLANHGVEPTLLTTNDDPERRLDVPLNRVVVTDGVSCMFHNAWRIAGRYGLSPSMMKALRNTVASYDLVHIHWLYNFSCVAAARTAEAARVPFVVQPRGSLDPYMYKRRKINTVLKRVYLATVARPLLTRAAAVVYTAEQERDRASPRPRRPEWIVPNGLDLSRYQQLPPPGTFRAAFPGIDGPFLLFMGRLARQKGLDLLLGAFERLARTHPDLWLVVAGPGHEGYEAHVYALARKLGLERVLFPGMLTGELKLAAFVDAELFVLPSYMENFGTVIIEALACGLPVVISDQVHIHRELAAAGAATVVSCSIDSVSAGIEGTLADTGAHQRMRSLGPELVRARYTWDAVAPMLIAKYRELIAARSSSQ